MRPDRADPFTFDEHRDLAGELRSARAKLRELCAMVSEVYGPDHRAALAFVKTLESLEQLCAELRVQAAQDCPDGDTTGLYE